MTAPLNRFGLRTGIEAAIGAGSRAKERNMTTETNTNRPTQRVYAVIKKEGNKKGTWLEIGVAWPHRDGKGYGVKLNLIPFSGTSDIVIRTIEQQPAAKTVGKTPANKGGA